MNIPTISWWVVAEVVSTIEILCSLGGAACYMVKYRPFRWCSWHYRKFLRYAIQSLHFGKTCIWKQHINTAELFFYRSKKSTISDTKETLTLKPKAFVSSSFIEVSIVSWFFFKKISHCLSAINKKRIKNIGEKFACLNKSLTFASAFEKRFGIEIKDVRSSN